MDWLATDPLADELDQLGAASGSHDEHTGPALPLWPPGYYLDERGLWYRAGEDAAPVQLSGPFTVLGLARDLSGDGWAIALEWRDPDGVVHQHYLPRADLIGDRNDGLKPLLSGGLELAPQSDRLKRFRQALLGLECGRRLRLVKRSGWHGTVFVLPHGTLGHTEGEWIVYDGSSDAARYAQAGTLEEWIACVAAPAAGNSRLVFALSTAFAGPLADLLGDEGGGVHLVGGSSLGKSTALFVAGSVWGGGGRGGFTQTWRATGNALEAIARAHSGTLLALDELGELDAKEAGGMAYLLVNGQGKGRGTRDGGAKERAEWRVMLLSTGEIGLADKIAETGRRAKAGQLVRLVDVPADAGKGQGLFEDTKGHSPADFSRKVLVPAALRVYGTPGPVFVEMLANDPDAVARFARERIGAVQRALLDGTGETSGQVHRVAHRFALIATAGELARVALGLPWAEDEAERAAAICFEAWRSTIGGEGPRELVAAVEAIRAAVEKHGESRFRTLQDASGLAVPSSPYPMRDLLGYRFHREGEWLWGFTATGWREVLAGVAEPRSVVAMLADRGALYTGGADRANRYAVKVDGQTVWVHAVKASALAD
ncbi:MAG TPA: DUF927 domain-containing protein [Microvirga sp.]|jgi:putative DNA primase/helicase